MGKYTGLNDDIFSVFASKAWQLEQVKTVPVDFVQANIGDEYIRVDIVSGGQQPANRFKSVNGLLMVEIFTPAGEGPKKANLIADKLDKYLAGKTLKSGTEGQTQFDTSNLASKGVDKANSSLFKHLYTIPFNYFGA